MNALQIIMNSAKNRETEFSIIKGAPSTPENACHLLQFDGLSEPNPGISTGGAVVFAPETRRPLFERGEFIDFATNNQAEYMGLLIGVKKASEMGIKHLLIEGDSQLVINQVAGKWKVKNETLRALHKELEYEWPQFDFVAIRHVYRNNNKYADKITNDVLQTRQSYFRMLSTDNSYTFYTF